VADTKISALTSGTATSGDEVPVNRAGTNYKVTVQAIAALAPATDLTYTAATRVLASSTGTDATLPLVTSTEAGLAPLSGGGTSNFLRADGTWAAPGGGSPGGSTTHVQFNDGGAFGGDSGFTFDKTNKTVGLGGGTITADDPVLDLTQTWNNGAITFNGIKLNVTDTASGAASLLLDLKVGGATKFSVKKDGQIAPATISISGTYGGVGTWASSNGFSGNAFLYTGGSLGFNSGGAADLLLYKDAAQILAQRNGTNAQTYRLYNTYTDSSNYERVTINWASNVCYLQPQNAGTGSARIFVPVTGSTTVSGLPAASSSLTGARAFVTDANSTTFLSTVASGGSNKVPVVCDGTNWLIG
jgi:hypothetical protein